MDVRGHRLAVALTVLAILALVNGAALALVIAINWATLPGPEAGIVSSIITAVVTGTAGLSGPIIGYYFGSSPTETD